MTTDENHVAKGIRPSPYGGGTVTIAIDKPLINLTTTNGNHVAKGIRPSPSGEARWGLRLIF